MHSFISLMLSVMLLVGTSGALAASLPAIKCAKGDVGVACLVNPCGASSCKPKPYYACVPNYCSKATTYLGNKLPASPCSAVWINTKTKKKVACPPPVEVCNEIYAPVCGADKKTYPNKCFAGAAGVKVAFDGLCIFPPTCTKKYKPVCSKAGETWPSACSAKYNGVKSYTTGACIRGPCASCVKPPGTCGAANPCKGKPQYTCQSSPCGSQQVFDDGSRVTVGLCGAVYYSKKTGFPATACRI